MLANQRNLALRYSTTAPYLGAHPLGEGSNRVDAPSVYDLARGGYATLPTRS
jgi:hypothetical protein